MAERQDLPIRKVSEDGDHFEFEVLIPEEGSSGSVRFTVQPIGLKIVLHFTKAERETFQAKRKRWTQEAAEIAFDREDQDPDRN